MFLDSDMYLRTVVVIVIGVALGLLAIFIVVYVLYYYVFSRLFSKTTTIQASVYLKLQNPDPSDYIDPLAADMETASFWGLLWDKILELVKYDQWRPQWLDDHYRVIFNANGRRLELSVPASAYIDLIEGQHGVLTYKGTQFVNYMTLEKRDENPGYITLDNP